MRWADSAFAAILSLCVTPVSHAEEPQSFSAKVGDETFVSDDDGILLVPVMGTFTLSASTQGASAYPPPKTPIDRLSISCDLWDEGKPVKHDSKKFADSSACRASFTKGGNKATGTADVEYVLDEASPDNVFEVTAHRGKVIEGSFQFTMKDSKGAKLKISGGRFKAEDRQI